MKSAAKQKSEAELFSSGDFSRTFSQLIDGPKQYSAERLYFVRCSHIFGLSCNIKMLSLEGDEGSCTILSHDLTAGNGFSEGYAPAKYDASSRTFVVQLRSEVFSFTESDLTYSFPKLSKIDKAKAVKGDSFTIFQKLKCTKLNGSAY